jgi:hypothetical protein
MGIINSSFNFCQQTSNRKVFVLNHCWFLMNNNYNRVIHKVTLLSSPCLWASFHPPETSLSTSNHSSLQSKENLLNLGMKCWNSTFNAQGWKVIIVAVHVGAVKIYVATVERSGVKTGWTQFITKIDGFLSFWVGT